MVPLDLTHTPYMTDNDENLNRLSPNSIPTDNNISVLATTRNDTKASYSSLGKYRVDLGAPGGEVADELIGLQQDTNPNVYNYVYGTSAAAPHVTGALALIKSLYPWENYLGIRDRVLMGAERTPGNTLDGICRTNGRLNLYKALQPRSLLLNLSTRARVEGGDKVMIAGFVIGGRSGPCGGLAPNPPCLKVVMRGLGPSVGVNVPKLVDPVIELHGPPGFATIINDNWQDDPDQAELVALGLQPSYPSEAAMIRSLGPGAYTVILRTATGSSNDYGVGLVELYALENNEQFRFINLSTRCLVGTDDGVAIAGTIIGNSSASPTLPRPDRRLLILGKGPSLGMGFDSSIFLSNPQIQVAGTSLYNDDWKRLDDNSGVPGGCTAANTDNCNALQEKLDDAHFSPLNLLESALWPTFIPGAYTVILSGENQSTGIGLIEFYEQ